VEARLSKVEADSREAERDFLEALKAAG